MATKATTKKTAPKKAEKSTGFAVIATGGKQYIVRVGDVITIEKMKGSFENGKEVSFDQVLLTTDGSSTKVGTPTVGGKVTATFVEEGRGKKIDVIKYKAKSRYYKKRGHRQPFMKFKVTSIA